MTLIKIDIKEKDALAYSCAACSIKVNFFTMENNELMLQAEIEEDHPGILFRLGTMTKTRMEMEFYKAKIEQKI